MTGQAPTFAFASGYMGCVHYVVHGDGEPYEVTLRRDAPDYERSAFHGSQEEWERDVVAGIGLLRRSQHSERQVPEAVLRAFNAWRARDHENAMRRILSDPGRYGTPDPADPAWRSLTTPPAPVAAAVYEVRWNEPGAPDRWRHGHQAVGWRVTTPAVDEPAARAA